MQVLSSDGAAIGVSEAVKEVPVVFLVKERSQGIIKGDVHNLLGSFRLLLKIKVCLIDLRLCHRIYNIVIQLRNDLNVVPGACQPHPRLLVPVPSRRSLHWLCSW